MLQSLRVERFKSLVKLELPLGRINVLIGANGSGKSNILEALGVLGAAAFGRVDDETLIRRGVRPGLPDLYKTAFPGSHRGPHILVEATSGSGASFRTTLWHPKRNPGQPWHFKTECLQRSAGDIVASRSPASNPKLNPEAGIAALKTAELPRGDRALLLMNELRNYGIHCPNTPALRGLGGKDDQPRSPVGLTGARLPEALDEVMKGAPRDTSVAACLQEARDMIDWAREISAEPSADVPLSPSAARSRLVIQFTDRFMRADRNRLSGHDASEGALYVLYSAVLALHPEAPTCLAVDNLDQALNPRLATKLMASLCNWTKRRNGGRQWLVTVHNPAILDGLPLDQDDVRLFAVDRNNLGHTVARRIDLDSAKKLRPGPDWTLSRMWTGGYLGGVPNV